MNRACLADNAPPLLAQPAIAETLGVQDIECRYGGPPEAGHVR